MTSLSWKSILGALVFLLAFAFEVQAATYNFYQAFSDGGYVRGSFSGEDKHYEYGGSNVPPSRPDGQLNTCSGRYCPFPEFNEVTDFSIEFGGNRVFNRLNNLPNVGLRSLTGLSYDIDNNVLNHLSFGFCGNLCDQHWWFAFYGNFSLIEVTAGLNPPGYKHLQIESYNPVQTFQTPLPGAFWLFLAGFAPIAGLLRKKRQLRPAMDLGRIRLTD